MKQLPNESFQMTDDSPSFLYGRTNQGGALLHYYSCRGVSYYSGRRKNRGGALTKGVRYILKGIKCSEQYFPLAEQNSDAQRETLCSEGR